ncbi:MAG TPA: hypothetical protein VHX36_04050 [Candidatus Acidoferrales bacterium]|jgi:hypothetical protein|nr:hypothetical protein [Candidatus Acidoferrales bacterium]
MADRTISQSKSDKPPVPTAGRAFADGSMLELVRIPGGDLNLLAWDGKSAKIAAQLAHNDGTYAPLSVDPVILRSMPLPSNVAKYGSTRELFIEISSLISRVTGAGDSFVHLLTFFTLATWFADCLPVAPYAWIVAPPTTTPGPLVDLLSALCRRSLSVIDISTIASHPVVADLQLTLLTEVVKPTRRVLNLLRPSNRRAVRMIAGGKAVDASIAKIVVADGPLRDLANGGFPLQLVLSPTRKYVPSLTSSEAERIVAEFQNKLLYYRLSNRGKLREPTSDLGQLTPAMRVLAHTLAAPIVDDDELQSQVVSLLKPLDTEIRAYHESQLPAIILEALLAGCHGATTDRYGVSDLTTDVNTIFRGRGNPPEASPEDIGWGLRGLGLHTDFLPGGRKCVVLSKDVREEIHNLAAAHGVRSLHALPDEIRCPLCAALAIGKRRTHIPRLPARGRYETAC